jgi:hypothetical protein
MKTVARFHKIEEAYLFRSYLESEDIPAHVFDEYIPQLFWTWIQVTGGVRVVVAAEDSDRAGELFSEYESRILAAPAVVGDVKFWPLALLATVIIGLPFMIFGRRSPEAEPGNP